jgi:hypothetical protein
MARKKKKQDDDEMVALAAEIGPIDGVYGVYPDTDLNNFAANLSIGDLVMLGSEAAGPVLDELKRRLRRERRLELHHLNGQELLETGKFPVQLFMALAGWVYAVRPGDTRQ